MKNRIYPILVALGAVLLCSCASIPTYQEPDSVDAASISGSGPILYVGGLASVFIGEIDGLAPPGSSFDVTPGKHRIGLMTQAFGYQQAVGFVEVNLKPRHDYVFKAKLVGMTFHVDLVDKTGKSKVVVDSYKMVKGANSAPPPTPIFIPIMT